ncbi:MAG: hypothetical protein AAGE52_40610 [Myxococcota bacterium]
MGPTIEPTEILRNIDCTAQESVAINPKVAVWQPNAERALLELLRDTPEHRRTLGDALRSLQDAVAIRYVRARRHTLRSAAGGVLDALSDELAGAEEPGGKRPGDPGVMVIAFSSAGELGRFWFHPVAPDFESALLPLLLDTCQRTGAAFEFWVEDEPRYSSQVTKPPAPSYREAPPSRTLAPLAKSYRISDDGTQAEHRRAEPPQTWAAAILGILAVLCFPITFLALLIPETRRILREMMTRFLHGWSEEWRLILTPHALRVLHTPSDAPPREEMIPLPLLLAAPLPQGWTGATPELVAVRSDRVIRVPCPDALAVCETLNGLR